MDTLGNTKWRVNKKVLSIVDRVWANGGRLADLVDRDDVSYLFSFHSKYIWVSLPLLTCRCFSCLYQFSCITPFLFLYVLLLLVSLFQVPLPEKPDTEDESELKRWKWKVRSLKKENRERHSQRCDVELKLAVSNIMLEQSTSSMS